MQKPGQFFALITEAISRREETADDEQRLIVPPRSKPDRRRILRGMGMLAGAGGALAVARPARADDGEDQINGLWQGVVSAADHSFPPFKTFELYGGGLWISSGNTDLTLGALDSSLWAAFRNIGARTFQGVGRFWTYSANFNPTGFGALVQTTTLSKDGKSYHGQGPLQFFDMNGNPLGPPTIILDDGVRIA